MALVLRPARSVQCADPSDLKQSAGTSVVDAMEQSDDPTAIAPMFELIEDDSAERIRDERPMNHVVLTRLARGTSSHAARDEAIAALPLKELSGIDRRRVEQIVRSHTMFRRLPAYAFTADPSVYNFFAARPDVTISMWHAMEMSQFQLKQTEPGRYDADSGDGSTGAIDVLYRTDRQQLILCQGEYKSPLLFKPIEASAILHLQTELSTDEPGHQQVKHTLDLFVSFPSLTVRNLAKVISPVSNLIADRNFREVTLFVKMMSVAMSTQPEWVEEIANRLEGIDAAGKEQLLQLTSQVYQTAQQQHAGTAGLASGKNSISSISDRAAKPAELESRSSDVANVRPAGNTVTE